MGVACGSVHGTLATRCLRVDAVDPGRERERPDLLATVAETGARKVELPYSPLPVFRPSILKRLGVQPPLTRTPRSCLTQMTW